MRPSSLAMITVVILGSIPSLVVAQQPDSPSKPTDWIGLPLDAPSRQIPRSPATARTMAATIRNAIEDARLRVGTDATLTPVLGRLAMQKRSVTALVESLELESTFATRLRSKTEEAERAESERTRAEAARTVVDVGEVAESRAVTLRSTRQEFESRAARFESELGDLERRLAALPVEREKANTKLREAREARLAADAAERSAVTAGDPLTVRLARETAMAARLEEAYLERHVEHLVVRAAPLDQIERRLHRARLATTQAEIETATARLALVEERLRDAARSELERVANEIEIDRERREGTTGRERIRLELTLAERERRQAELRVRADIVEWNARFNPTSSLGLARSDAQGRAREVEIAQGDDTEDPFPNDTTTLRTYLEETHRRETLLRTTLRDLQVDLARVVAAQREADRWHRDLPIRLAAMTRRDDVELAVWEKRRRSNELEKTSAAHKAALEEFRESLGRRIQEVQPLLSTVQKNRDYLKRRLLWAREESLVSVGSLRQAFADLAGIGPRVTAWGRRTIDGVVRHVSAPTRSVRVIAGSLVVLVLVGAYLTLRARLPKTEGAVADDDATPAGEDRDLEDAFVVFGGILRATGRSFVLALIAVGWPLAVGLPRSVWVAPAVLLATPFVFQFLRLFGGHLFAPDDSRRRLLPVDSDVAVRLQRATRYLLNASLVLLPLALVLTHGGYGARNPGFCDLLWFVFSLVVYLILLATLLRPAVVRGLIRGKGIVAASVKAALLVIYPLLAAALVGLVALKFLRFEVATKALGASLLKTVVLLFVVYVVYRKLVFIFCAGRDIDRRVISDDFDDKPAYEIAASAAFVDRLSRFGMRLLLFVPALLACLSFWPESIFDDLDMPLGGEGSITVARILWAVFIFVATIVGVRYFSQAMRHLVMPRTGFDTGAQYTLTALASYALIAVGIVVSLRLLRVQGNQIAWFVSALALGIGFGLQSIVRNLFSGLILLVERPVKVGDRVVVGNASGVVERITMRATTVMTWDGHGLVIPNEHMVGNTLENQSLGSPRLRTRMTISVAYGSDVDVVRRLVIEVMRKHKLIRRRPGAQILFTNFGESSLDFDMLYWTDLDANRPLIASDIRFAIDAAFRRANIEIPFPQRDIHIRTVHEETDNLDVLDQSVSTSSSTSKAPSSNAPDEGPSSKSPKRLN